MEIKCLLCGQEERVEKWQPEYDKLRKATTAAYICNSCQTKVQAENLDKGKPKVT